MKMHRTWIALALCGIMLLTLGCASAVKDNTTEYASEPAMAAYDAAAPQEEKASGYAMSESESTTTTTQTGEQTSDFDVRKIVYNADMTITADDPEKALNDLLGQAQALGGYVSGSYTTTDDLGAYYCTATLKVPADKLDQLITAAEAAGKVEDYRLSSDDISLSYYDVQARLDNAKSEEQQLLLILAQCETVEEILAVRQSLSSVRADIESYTGQINLWDNLVAYATLNVTINRTPKTAVEGESNLIQIWKASDVWDRMSRGFQNSARFVVNALGAIGIFLAIIAIPAGVLFLLIGVPIIVHKKKKNKRISAERAMSAPKAEPDDTTKKNE